MKVQEENFYHRVFGWEVLGRPVPAPGAVMWEQQGLTGHQEQGE